MTVSAGVAGECFFAVDELFQGLAIVRTQRVAVDDAAGLQAGEAAASFNDVSVLRLECLDRSGFPRLYSEMSASAMPTRVQASSTARYTAASREMKDLAAARVSLAKSPKPVDGPALSLVSAAYQTFPAFCHACPPMVVAAR